MGWAWESVTYKTTAAGAVETTASVLPGEQVIIRDAKNVWMHSIETYRQAAGYKRVTSPLLHDTKVGIVRGALAGNKPPCYGPLERLTPQDTLTVAHTGSAVAGDVEYSTLLVCYQDLAGISGSFINHEKITGKAYSCPYSPRIVIPVGVGDYGAEVAWNVTEDQMIANRSYALVGYSLGSGLLNGSVRVGLKSSDWGFLRISCPVVGDLDLTSRYWDRMDLEAPFPAIPVINSNQRQTIRLSCLGDENGNGSITFVPHLVLLSDGGSRCK